VSTRRRLTSICKQKIKQRFGALDEQTAANQGDFFPRSGDIPHPLFLDQTFDVGEAWWLAELCRLIYMPDSKEFTRVWNARKPDRAEILEARTPFRELLDVHKTGNSAAIYEMGAAGTVLCFRGTAKPFQWISNMVFHPHKWERFREPGESSGIYVHSGFYVMFKRIWPLLWPSLRLSPRPWIFTGHSLGGALAMLANAVVKADKVYTFGAPRIGNAEFAATYLQNTIRIVNHQDIVPLLPAKNLSPAEKDFNHGGQLVWLSDKGELVTDEVDHLEKQPWHLLEEWSRVQEDLFGKIPSWIEDHGMGQYSRKLAAHL
jgi:Lipase (class 3)